MKDYLDSEAKVVSLNYYTGRVGSFDKQSKFLEKMKEIGYRVTSKEIKLIKINNNKFLQKGNLDIELALDAFREKNNYDTLLLFSGDSDFAYLLDLLRLEGKRVIVISTRKHISIDLLKRAKYIDMRKIRGHVEFEENSKGRRSAP